MLARDQGVWIIIGLVVFAVVVFAFRDIRKLEGLRYTCGAAAVLLLAATVVIGTEVNGAKLWIRFGGLPDPAGRVREGAAGRVHRRLPAREPRGAGTTVPPRDRRRRAGAAAPAAAARDVGPRDGPAGRRERLRLVAAVLLDPARDAVRRHRPLALRRRRHRGVRRRRAGRGAGRAARAGPHRHLDRSVGHAADERLPDRAVAVLDRRRRHLRHRLRPRLHPGRQADRHPRRPDRLHLLGDRVRDRPGRRRRAAARLPRVRLPRHEDRVDGR